MTAALVGLAIVLIDRESGDADQWFSGVVYLVEALSPKGAIIRVDGILGGPADEAKVCNVFVVLDIECDHFIYLEGEAIEDGHLNLHCCDDLFSFCKGQSQPSERIQDGLSHREHAKQPAVSEQQSQCRMVFFGKVLVQECERKVVKKVEK